jgi:hypothetical protein
VCSPHDVVASEPAMSSQRRAGGNRISNAPARRAKQYMWHHEGASHRSVDSRRPDTAAPDRTVSVHFHGRLNESNRPPACQVSNRAMSAPRSVAVAVSGLNDYLAPMGRLSSVTDIVGMTR